jgi:hypothetical protein
MQPAHSPSAAHPGNPMIPGKRFFSAETGTVLCPEDVSRYLRLKHIFTPVELEALGPVPPPALLAKSTRKTLIVPLPSASIQEMAAEFTPTHRPCFRMNADHFSQAWVREREPARWVRLELAHRLHWHSLLETGERIPTAREQVALMLICHEDPDLPNFMEVADRHATSTRSADGFAVSVRLYQKEFRFLNVSDERMADLSAVILRQAP